MKRLTKKEQVAVIETAIYCLEEGTKAYICTALVRGLFRQAYTKYEALEYLHSALPTLYKAIVAHGIELNPQWFDSLPWELHAVTKNPRQYRIDWLKAYLTKLKK
jgi:hypothetical protein